MEKTKESSIFGTIRDRAIEIGASIRDEIEILAVLAADAPDRATFDRLFGNALARARDEGEDEYNALVLVSDDVDGAIREEAGSLASYDGGDLGIDSVFKLLKDEAFIYLSRNVRPFEFGERVRFTFRKSEGSREYETLGLARLEGREGSVVESTDTGVFVSLANGSEVLDVSASELRRIYA